MSPQSGGNGGDLRGAGSSAAKGALLIAVAIVIGIFLLQQVDSDADTRSTPPGSTKPKTTTTVAAGPSSSTTTVPALPAKEPDQLAVIVLNGGAPSGTADDLRTQLLQAGYTNQPDANNWEGHTQTGKSVLCKPGREREAVALSQQAALQGASVEAFPDPAPPFSEELDCVVVVGAA
jgi:hypothetical protein